MATVNIAVLAKETLRGGRVLVTYSASGKEGVRYICEAASDRDVDEAVAAHIRKRQTAGKYYAGEPESAPERTIIV